MPFCTFSVFFPSTFSPLVIIFLACERKRISGGLFSPPKRKRKNRRKYACVLRLSSFQNISKGWFPHDRRRSQTIADRKSQIADDRKESCFHIIADDRKRSQSRLQPYISVSRNVKCTRALCSRQNLFSKQHSGHRGGNFAASKFTSSFSPEATASSSSKAKETPVLSSKNIHEETKTWGFPHTAERTSCF